MNPTPGAGDVPAVNPTQVTDAQRAEIVSAERERGTSIMRYATAALIKARWACEQAHQQLKEELGLDHFEGRSWTGLHRHALMAMLALCFLQHLRLRERGKKRGRAIARPAAPADPAGHPAPAARVPQPRARPMPLLRG